MWDLPVITFKEGGGPCPVCNIHATKRCSKCAAVHYCSKEHQTEHWPMHKRYCKKLQSAKQLKEKPLLRLTLTEAQKSLIIPEEVGSKFTVAAILFPFDEDHPRIIDMPFEVERDDQGDGSFIRNFHMHDLSFTKKILGDTRHGWGYIETGEANGVTKCELQLMFRDNFMNDGSVLNRSIQNLTGGDMAHSWSGNVLAFRYRRAHGMEMESEFVVNVEENDLQLLRNHFLTYGHGFQ